MSGLNPCSEFYPWGYNDPLQPPAQKLFPKPTPPSDYNRNAIRGPAKSRVHVPVPVSGPMRPPKNGQDFFGDKNAATWLPAPQDPKSFNVNAIGTNYTATYPVLTAWSREAAKSQVADSSGGAIEPPKDLRAVAETFAKTASDEKERDWWERRVNALSQLEAITITRGLNPQEQQLKDEILKQITDKSSNIGTITANLNPQQGFVPRPVPASAADIAAMLAAHAASAQASSSSQSIKNIVDPVNYGPPQGPDIVEYTKLPEDWSGPAVPGFAIYKANPQDDQNAMIANLRAYYNDTPSNPAKIPPNEMSIWTNAVQTMGFPKGSLDVPDVSTNESDIDYISRATRSKSRVFWAYLGNPNYFQDYMSDIKTNIPELVNYSSQAQFPKHPGMQLVLPPKGSYLPSYSAPSAPQATPQQARPPRQSTPPKITPSKIAQATFSALSEPSSTTQPPSKPNIVTRARAAVAALTPGKKKGKSKSQGP